MKINVIDAMCGAGKTSAAINYINQTPDDVKIMYITPFRPELDRIIHACPSKKFYTPKGMLLSRDIKRLLNRGENIVTTHALFKLFDEETIEMCYSQGYILIMDEVTQVIEPFSITEKDSETLFEKYFDIGDDGLINWKEEFEDYTGRFDDVKRLVSMHALASYGGQIMLWLFPISIFKAFTDSYILTYMFDAQMQRYYYDFYGLEYNYLYVAGDSHENYHFTDDPQEYSNYYEYSQLINIFDDRKMNRIGDKDKSLSKNWYSNNADGFLGQQLQRNLGNYYRNRRVLYKDGEYITSSANEALWTTFKDYRANIKGPGYAKGFLSSNARAMNNYSDRHVVAYTINRFMNPVIRQFFQQHGIEVDEDRFALSDMIQWIWRSAIRNGEHITIYIPSYRMRKLLIDWINENSSEPIDTGELLMRSM